MNLYVIENFGQIVGGFVLFALVYWQLALGMRWIKLGRNHSKIHKWSGIALAVFILPHTFNGLVLLGIIKL